MLKKTRTAFCLCLVIAVFSGTAFTGAGAAQQRSLPDSFLIGDTDGIQVSRDGTYCILAEDLEPGQVIKKLLVIQNLDQGKPESVLPYTLLMLAEPLEETGPVKLLDVVRLELKLDGQVIYSGPCRGNAQGNDMTQTPLDLGVYEQGDRRDMEITLTVDGGMPVARVGEEQSVAEFAWHFYAERGPLPPPGTSEPVTRQPSEPGTRPPGTTEKPIYPPGTSEPPGPGKSEPYPLDIQPPKTGDLLKLYAPYELMALGVMLLWFALLLAKKKRERDARDEWILDEALG